MKTIVTQGIVLNRTDYGEADRILHFLTPDQGKLTGIAKGVRKSKSKLAGGIELFSTSELSFIVGKSEIYTIISARLIKHFGNIVKELNRTNTGYETIRLLNKATEDNPEAAYFNLLTQTFEALDNLDHDPKVTDVWFKMQLVKLAGHTPNLKTDCDGAVLLQNGFYNFNFDNMCFESEDPQRAVFNANHIKFLRLGFGASRPQILHNVTGSNKLAGQIEQLIASLLTSTVRV
jgi:DNA repair protein RecO